MKKNVIFIILIIIILVGGICAYYLINKNEAVDKVIKGTIYIDNEKQTTVTALAIKGDKIVFAGDESKVNRYIGKNTEVVTLKETETVMAGFNDGHNHASTSWSRQLGAAQIPESATTVDEYIKIIQEYVDEHPEKEYYKAYGWIDSAFNGLVPSAEMLDRVKTDKPIVATASDGHSEWVNTAMLKLMNIDENTKVPAGGTMEKDENGNPIGCFRDNATRLVSEVLPKETAADYIEAIEKSQEEYASLGYTSYTEALINDKGDLYNTPVADAYEQLDKEGKLKIYTQGSFVTTNNDDYLKLVDKAIELKKSTKGGMFEVTEVKVFLDGVVEGRTAYLSEPYSNDPENYGASSWTIDADIEKLKEIVIKANNAGMAVHFHAIGDQASTNAVEAVERAYNEIGDAVLEARNIVVHLQIVNKNIMEKMVKLNMIADINPWSYKSAGYFEEIEIPFLGEERANNEYPIKDFINSGVHVAGGTDYGASFVYDPIECYHVYVTRMDRDDNPESLLNESQRLTSSEALTMMSAGSAYQMHKENEYGTLEVQKKANLIILNQDLFKITNSDIMKTDVVKTMSNGEWIY